MKKIEDYINRSKEIAEETLFLEDRPLNKGCEFSDFLKLPKGEQFKQILYHIKDGLPESFLDSEWLKNRFYQTDELPFNPENFLFKHILGHGTTSEVYLLKNKDKKKTSWALKVLKESYIKKNFDNIHEAAVFFREELAEIKSWYGEEMEHLFLQEFFIESKGPKGKPAFIILQEYLNGFLRDIFEDLDEKDWEEIRRDVGLRRDLLDFINKTLEHERKTGETLDLIGKKNISINYNVDHEGNESKKLVILDPHWIHYTKDGAEAVERTCEKLERLREIKKILIK